MSEKKQKYRGAIVGLGFIGAADQVSGDALGQRVEGLDGTHLHAMLNHPQVELVAGSSRDSGRRERFTERTPARTYADWREMLASEQLDIVSVATYAPQHAEMTIACAERGVRAVFCEKPVATRLADAEEMLAACDRAGCLLVINHIRRFWPNLRRLSELVVAGEIGDLTSVSVEWGSGRLGNVGTHMFDAIGMLTGRRVEAVSATLDLSGRPDCRGDQFRDPGGWGVLRLEGGTMATFDASDHGCIPARIAINGTKGRALVSSDMRIDYHDGRSTSFPDEEPAMSSMDRAMGEIVEWLDDGRAFPCSGTDSVSALEVIVACHASHRRSAAWTALPLEGVDRDIVVQSG